MIRLLKPLFRGLRALRRREDGNATIEFVILFPAFIMIFVSAFESGILMTRNVMLERALDISVRGLRLGVWKPAPTHTELKRTICNLAGIIPDCMNTVLVELRPVDNNTWEPLTPNATCVDRDEEINTTPNFNSGTDNELMLVRVCAVFDPIFPLSSLGLKLAQDNTGAYALVATTAFVNEPSS